MAHTQHTITARRLSMWLTVGGVSLLTALALNVTADKFPQAKGLSTLRDYIYRSNG